MADEPKIHNPFGVAVEKVRKRKSREAQSIKRNQDLSKFERQLLEVLRREIRALLTDSYAGSLRSERSKALIDYMKLTRELKEHKKLEEELKKLENNNE